MSKLLISLHFLLFLVMSSGISLGWQEWNGPAFEAPTDPFEQAFDSNEVTVPESEKLKQLEQRIADLEKALL